jgi:hypothetical protein
MSVAEQLRAKALKCIKRATRLNDHEHKQLYFDLAIQWMALATEVEARTAESASISADVDAAP